MAAGVGAIGGGSQVDYVAAPDKGLKGGVRSASRNLHLIGLMAVVVGVGLLIAGEASKARQQQTDYWTYGGEHWDPKTMRHYSDYFRKSASAVKDFGPVLGTAIPSIL